MARKPRRRRFKNAAHQETYDWFRANKPGPETASMGAAHNAYFVGRHINQERPFAAVGSFAYAGWAAGVDDARELAALVADCQALAAAAPTSETETK